MQLPAVLTQLLHLMALLPSRPPERDGFQVSGEEQSPELLTSEGVSFRRAGRSFHLKNRP